MKTIKALHETIKSRIATRTTNQLISDAKVARSNKTDETQRMIFALTMDVLSERMTEKEFNALFDEIAI